MGFPRGHIGAQGLFRVSLDSRRKSVQGGRLLRVSGADEDSWWSSDHRVAVSGTFSQDDFEDTVQREKAHATGARRDLPTTAFLLRLGGELVVVVVELLFRFSCSDALGTIARSRT